MQDANTAHYSEHSIHTGKHGSGFSSAVTGKMVGAKYRTILEGNLLESAKDLRVGQGFNSQQDNHTEHKGKTTTEWFQTGHIHVLE